MLLNDDVVIVILALRIILGGGLGQVQNDKLLVTLRVVGAGDSHVLGTGATKLLDENDSGSAAGLFGTSLLTHAMVLLVDFIHVGGGEAHTAVRSLQDLASGIVSLRPPGLQGRCTVIRLVEAVDLGGLVILSVMLRAHTLDHGVVCRMILHTFKQLNLHRDILQDELNASLTLHPKTLLVVGDGHPGAGQMLEGLF
ncbi:hypothetical protein PG990_015296 [Apiospora arundinis]